jgi:hypothetical protein
VRTLDLLHLVCERVYLHRKDQSQHFMPLDLDGGWLPEDSANRE